MIVRVATHRGLTWRGLGLAAIKLRPVAIAVYLACGCIPLAMSYVNRPALLFGDVRIYFRATAAWLSGTNPWLANNDGALYAAPPPALLLNVPLVPLGEQAAVLIWVAASAVAVAYIIRNLHLPLWFVLFYPLVEAFFGGSPDLVLAALVLAGLGAVAAMVKPYSIPAMLSDRRWRAVVAAAVVTLLTMPILPWGEFFANGSAVVSVSAGQSHPNSALGIPWLMVVTAIALVSLGPRRALALVVPALIGQQPHYAVFSLLAISGSTAATLGGGWPAQGAAAVGVIAYALTNRIGLARSARTGIQSVTTLASPDEPAAP
jgi:hypothetical protein